MRGDWERAEGAYLESLRVARVIRSRRMVAVSSLNLANARLHAGAAAEALALTRESVAMSRELGDVEGRPNVLLTLARIDFVLGNRERAAQLFGGAQAALRASGSPLWMADKFLGQDFDRELDATLGVERRSRLEADGAGLAPKPSCWCSA